MRSRINNHLKLLSIIGTLSIAGCGENAGDTTINTTEMVSTVSGNITTERLLNIENEPGSWLTGGRDYQQSYFSPLTDINKGNASELGFAWQYEIDTTHGFEATPIVVDGVMYSSGPKGAVYAVDAKTGAEKWMFEPEIDPNIVRKVCCGMINRGISVWEGSVFVASLDGYLYALDAATGDVLWQQDTITERDRGYTITGAPYVAKDIVVIGNSGAELDARGYVTAYDTKTGKQAWRFYTVPKSYDGVQENPELEMAAKTWDQNSLWEVGLGGTVWDAMAYDPALNLLYIGTGNAAPYPRKLRSPSGGDNLFLSSILAINPDTGRLVWYYQTTPADNWDFTSTQKLILADLTINGSERKVLMQAPKNGFFYVLDRQSGELLSAEPYVPVNWASHVDLATGKPVETGQGEYFDEPKLVFPSPAGGHNWQPMAFNRETGLVYIPVLEASAVWRMPKEPFVYQKGGLNTTSQYFFPSAGSWGLDSEGAKGLPPLTELAKGQPDPVIRGYLRAWDPVQNKVAWEVETSDVWRGHIFAIWNGGGVMTTASDLVFQGRATGDLVMLDAKTGAELASINVGTSIMAAPMTYKIDGEQYVAVMAGLGGAIGQSYLPGTAAYKYGNKGRIVAFKLNGGLVPLRPEKQYDQPDGFPMPPVMRRGAPFQVKNGGELFERNCSKCHMNDADSGSGIPDLRRMTEQVHGEFTDILLKGIREEQGMGNFSELLTPEEVEAIHMYLIDLAWSTYESSSNEAKPHQPKEIEEQ
ncbi:PQQ-dependent dehydrogenase, methanol/ethanol family [Kordiimonas pumila]|uniref:PQQ-dependent dehydrogenase, methanol/ethanol family n=1 Tax=Kordiimonas pumila TaxID=2161677 RepID=A0ABV7D1L4_9PROT|nr:PQQ-dependent dehydrogenase, methanol/ethanol family [Kordiimonas pumila]